MISSKIKNKIINIISKNMVIKKSKIQELSY